MKSAHRTLKCAHCRRGPALWRCDGPWQAGLHTRRDPDRPGACAAPLCGHCVQHLAGLDLCRDHYRQERDRVEGKT